MESTEMVLTIVAEAEVIPGPITEWEQLLLSDLEETPE